jgi:hypothetical protein
LGSSLPPAELARRDSALFGEVKCLFSIAPKVGKETEAKEVTALTGRCTGRCTGRGHGLTGRVRSVQRGASARVCDRTLVWPDQRVRSVQLGVKEKRATGASGPSRDRSVRSCIQRGSEQWSDDRTRGASGHVRSDASGRSWSLLERDRTLTLSRPVTRLSASGQGNG